MLRRNAPRDDPVIATIARHSDARH